LDARRDRDPHDRRSVARDQGNYAAARAISHCARDIQRAPQLGTRTGAAAAHRLPSRVSLGPAAPIL